MKMRKMRNLNIKIIIYKKSNLHIIVQMSLQIKSLPLIKIADRWRQQIYTRMESATKVNELLTSISMNVSWTPMKNDVKMLLNFQF